MKRFISTLFLFVLCAIFVVDINVSPVSAADIPDYVYRQIITNVNNDKSAITVVSQKWQKTDLNNLEGPMATNNSYKNLTKDNICAMSSLNGLCKDSVISGSLAQLTIDSYGNIELELENDVKLTNLRIYYIIANRSNEAQLYCDDFKICEKAKNVNATNSNWKNQAKMYNFIYSESNIGNTFELLEIDGGKRIFTNFNIFKRISNTYSSLAQKYGIYVITSFSVEYNDVLYKVNERIIDNYQFSAVNRIDNPLPTISKGYSTKENPDITVPNIAVDGYAALVSSSVANRTENENYKEANNYFKDTIRPIIIIVIGIMFLITGGMTTLNIVKASDEPEVRREGIHRLLGIFIGAFVIVIILMFYEQIIEAVSSFF